MTAVLYYVIVVIVMSVASFLAYGFDKRRAGIAGRRVPERTLHLLAFLGGWPGALAGQKHFRHKTRKTRFLVAFWLVVAAHIAVVAMIGYSASVGGHLTR